ncbi:MAG TPA: DNA gyrase inhibitor YacG [Hyphomicrobiaceae bacterium]|nr:DNA gyrase inhibitor YacG [Hyphomicrobiaceae bacterium]
MGQSRPGPLIDSAPIGGKCPICSGPGMKATRPFCSKRCADVDLARWLRGAYTIIDDADADEDGDAPELARAVQGKSDGDERS